MANSLHFLKFKLLENWAIEELSEKIFGELEDEEEKFIPNEITNSIIDGYYVSYYNAKELMFNVDTNSLEHVFVKKNLIIPFSIDLENKVIDIWSSKSNANKLVTQLGIKLNHKVRIDAIDINLERIVSNLKGNNVKIGKIKIENYPIENDIIAKCIFDLKNHNKPIDIVKKYSKELLQVSLIISDGRDDWINMVIYKSGSVVIYKLKEEISLELLEYIRETCVR